MIQKRILVIEDDLNLGFLLLDFLETANLKVKLCRDGKAGLDHLKENHYDLCLIDIMMPNLDGFNLAKKLRYHNINVPFIFITAKSMKEDKMKGYELGAEDYITKPFDEEELLCKINVILRRTEKDPYESAPTQFSIGAFTFDYNRQELNYNTKVYRLTEKENDVLRLLCLHKNRILKRDDALTKIYGKNDYFLGRSFDVYISRLRKLLSEDTSVEIQNIYKVGFMLNIKQGESTVS